MTSPFSIWNISELVITEFWIDLVASFSCLVIDEVIQHLSFKDITTPHDNPLTEFLDNNVSIGWDPSDLHI